MKRISKITARRLAREILLLSALVTLINTTGCSRRFVVVDGGEKVSVPKGELDQLYRDNELLLKSLEECQSR